MESIIEAVDWRMVDGKTMVAVVTALLKDEPEADIAHRMVPSAVAARIASEHRMNCACCQRSHKEIERITAEAKEYETTAETLKRLGMRAVKEAA